MPLMGVRRHDRVTPCVLSLRRSHYPHAAVPQGPACEPLPVLGEDRPRLLFHDSSTGRPSIDPELMIRMLIVGSAPGPRRIVIGAIVKTLTKYRRYNPKTSRISGNLALRLTLHVAFWRSASPSSLWTRPTASGRMTGTKAPAIRNTLHAISVGFRASLWPAFPWFAAW